MAVVTIHLPAPLRGLVGGQAALRVEADTVGEALQRIGALHPVLGARLFADDGQVRGYVNIFLGNRDVRDLDDAGRRLEGEAELTIVPSIAGGAPESGLSPEEAVRYHRQMILPEVGEVGQSRLKAARVLLVGAGGLGSPAALYLAAAGVGELGIVDADEVELSNLQRQVLHDTPSVGLAKTESARSRLHRLNPDIEIHTYPVRLDSANALEILSEWDLVVDGSDNFPTRYLVNDACVLLDRPLVYGAILRFEGQASVFAVPGGPCYRCLFRDPPPPELVPSCAEAGVLGALPGLVGCIQAAEALKLLLGAGRTLVGRLLLIDALRMDFREVEVRRDPDCAVCGDRPTVTRLLDYERFCGGPARPLTEPLHVPEIDVVELRARLDEGRPVRLIDVREPHEWSICNLGFAGAQLMPLGQLFDRLQELGSDEELVVYCRTGHRSALAVRLLREAGVGGAVNLRGGIHAWATTIDPTMPTY